MAVDNPAVLRGGLQLTNAVPVNQILDEDTLTSNSDEAVPTQQSVKAYVDNNAVKISGTPADNQLAVWTGVDTIEGSTDLSISADGYLGIGRTDPDGGLAIAGDDGSAGSARVWRASADTGPSSLQLQKSRGTVASPSAVNAGDEIGRVGAWAHIDGGFDSTGQLAFWVEGTHTTYVSTYFTVNLRDSSNSYAERFRITSGGTLYAYQTWDDTVTSTRDLEIQSDGKIGYVSSAKRYKKYVKTLTDISFLYDLRPITFKFRKDSVGEPQYGLIAEEVEKVNKDFVFYNGDGEIEGVYYKKFIPVLIKANKELEKSNKALAKKLACLEKKLNKLSGNGRTKAGI